LTFAALINSLFPYRFSKEGECKMKVRGARVFLFVLLLSSSLWLLSQSQTLIRDILDNPNRYYNLQVTLQGDVVDVKAPAATGERGYYVLLDNSDKKIKIVANTLPAPQIKLTVSGVVQILTEDQEPYIREVGRVEGLGGEVKPVVVAQQGLSPLIIALGAFIVLVIIAILVVLFRKPQKQEVPAAPAVVPPPSGSTGTPTDARTRQVSIGEVERQVGGMKTRQVPSLLAELRVLTGNLSGKSFPLGNETVIGRVRGDIILEDASVSKEHAKVVFLGSKFAIENLSSTNPVIVNGEKVQAQKELKSGDEVIVGLIKMQFRLI
jgi:hypothetical protein